MRSLLRSRPTRRAVPHLADEHRGAVERRRAAAARLVGAAKPIAARIAAAPPGYVLAHASGDIVRHCELLSPAPGPREVRVVVTPGRGAGERHLDLACRDRRGLLAACTGVLATVGVEVLQAVVATWDDGAALEAFVVRADSLPDPGILQRNLEAALDEPLWSPAIEDATVSFDAERSALYTSCEVVAVDRPGLLHAFAVAMAAAGTDIHAASVTTEHGVARDRFDLSDTRGGKLGADLQDAIRARIRAGVHRSAS